jgi:hypothetical protein
MIYTMELPSRGKFKKIPSVVKVKEWSLFDIKEFSKSADRTLDDVFVDYLNRALSFEEEGQRFAAGELCEQDRAYILLNVRVNAIGPEYSFNYTHRDIQKIEGKDKDLCGTINEVKLNIAERVNVKDIPSSYKDFLKIEIPNGDQVRVKIPSYNYSVTATQRFEDKLGVTIDKLEEDDPDLMIFFLSLYFAGVGNHRFDDPMEAFNYICGLDSTNAQAIIKIVQHYRDWGPDLTVEGECKGCGKPFRFPFPFMDSFFFAEGRSSFNVEAAIKA